MGVSGEPNPFFNICSSTPQGESVPDDFINVFEYSVSDLNLDLLPTTPACNTISEDTRIDFEEGCITDSQLSEAYDTCMNAAGAPLSDQSPSDPIVDKLRVIEAKLNKQQQATDEHFQEIAEALSKVSEVINKTCCLLDNICTRILNV